MQATDLFVSRAGATAIFEMIALKKPMLLVPLSQKASRGDQILNAKSFEKQGFSYVIQEEDVTNEVLLDAVREVYEKRSQYVAAMSENGQMDSIGTIINLIETYAKKNK